MISGEMPTRRADHTLRSTVWNRRAFGFAFVGLPIACFDPVAYKIALSQFHPFEPEITLFGYGCGIGIPLALAFGLVLALLSFRQQLAEVPGCRTCGIWMQHQSRISSLAYTESAWRHAYSDCLAALHENLWQDAAKLLSMLGEDKPPAFERGMLNPLIQYHLDFFVCPRCGDENARITTEDKMGAGWKAREEYYSAYKSRDGDAKKDLVPLSERIERTNAVLDRTIRLAFGQLSPLYVLVCFVVSLFVGYFYYPQLLTLLGLPGFRALITIRADPAGLPIIVDGRPVNPPAKFSWALNSTHTIDAGLFRLRRKITIKPVINGWGRLTNVPEMSSYTVSLPTSYTARSPNGNSSPSNVLVTSDPVGLSVIVDGTSVVTPALFSWPVGSTHILIALSGLQYSPRTVARPGTIVYYNLGRWNATQFGHAIPKAGSSPDGNTISINVPSTTIQELTIFTAKFNRIVMPSNKAGPGRFSATAQK
jgi:hypothetical protein